MRNVEEFMTTAGGKIRCRRCTALSTRTHEQCRKPALKSSRTQKCEFHGGRPHTGETLRKISEANILHGEATKVAKAKARAEGLLLWELEDAAYFLKMVEGPRTRGRKPEGFRGTRNQEDLIKLMLGLHRI